jgi:type 1 glutamine amidotransferase
MTQGNPHQTPHAVVIVGGHPYDEPAFERMLSEIEDIRFTVAPYPEAVQFFRPDRARDVNAYVFYDFGQQWPEEDRAQFLARLDEGKGVLFLHHACWSQPQWPEYGRLVGYVYNGDAFEIDGVRHGPSRPHPDQRLRVHVCDPGHPVTVGVSDFDLEDETYTGCWIAPDATPLLTTDYAQSDHVLGFARPVRGARSVFLQPGHGPSAYNNPHYRRLLRNAVRWVSGAPSEVTR